MNRDPITLLLAAALLVSAIATAGVCFWYLQNVRQHQLAQEDLARINRNKNLMQTLAAESMEYAKKNPAMIPLLQGLGVRGRLEANSTAVQPTEP